MSEINYQALREAAERAIPAMERLLMLPADDDLLSEQELKDYGVDIDALNAFKFLAGPETVLALLDELDKWMQESSAWQAVAEKQLALATNAEQKIAELETAGIINKVGGRDIAELTKQRIMEDLKASTQNAGGMFEISEDTICALMSMFIATPLPVVPDEMTPKQASRSYCGEVRGYRDGWNACRAKVIGNMFLADMDRAATDNTNQQFESLSRGDK